MPAPEGILHHIRHAEQWLRWARSDYRRGDVRAMVLRLLLAEAEIRRARESGTAAAGGMPVPVRLLRRRASLVAAGLAATAVLAVTGYMVLRPTGSGPVGNAPHALHVAAAAGGPEGIVQFESGRLLTLVGFPPGPAERTGPAVSWDGDRLPELPLDELVVRAGDTGLNSASP